MATKKKNEEKVDDSFYLDMKKQFALDCEVHKFFWGMGSIRDNFLEKLLAFIKYLVWKLLNPNRYYSAGGRIPKKRFQSLENELKRIKKYEIERWLDSKIWGKYIV